MLDWFGSDSPVNRTKVTGGATIVTDSSADVGEASGGAVIVAGGPINVDEATGGAILISGTRVTVGKAWSAAKLVAAPEVTIKTGDVSKSSPQDALQNDKVQRKLSSSKMEKARRVIRNSGGKEAEQTRLSSSTRREQERRSRSDAKDSLDDQTNEERPPELRALDDIELSDDEIAAVVIADVIGLFCQDSPEYRRDRRIMLEAYPELGPIMGSASSVDDAVQLAEQHERLSFTPEQIDLMREDEALVERKGRKEVEFEELLY